MHWLGLMGGVVDGELGIGVKGVGAGNDEDVSLQLKFFTCSVGVREVKGHTVAASEAAALVRRHSRVANAGVLRAIVTVQRHVRQLHNSKCSPR